MKVQRQSARKSRPERVGRFRALQKSTARVWIYVEYDLLVCRNEQLKNCTFALVYAQDEIVSSSSLCLSRLARQNITTFSQTWSIDNITFDAARSLIDAARSLTIRSQSLVDGLFGYSLLWKASICLASGRHRLDAFDVTAVKLIAARDWSWSSLACSPEARAASARIGICSCL